MNFGTPQKLSELPFFNLKYKYLGVIVDRNLSHKVNLEKTYKKAMSRTKLLTRIRQNLTPYAAESIYEVMIRPIFLYCNNLMLGSKSRNIFLSHSVFTTGNCSPFPFARVF